jgi:hypothetical protein
MSRKQHCFILCEKAVETTSRRKKKESFVSWLLKTQVGCVSAPSLQIRPWLFKALIMSSDQFCLLLKINLIKKRQLDVSLAGKSTLKDKNSTLSCNLTTLYFISCTMKAFWGWGIFNILIVVVASHISKHTFQTCIAKCISLIFVLFCFCSTGVWTQSLHLEPLHQPFFAMGFFKIGFQELFSRAGFQPWSAWSLPPE